jgi:hypothetical protein
MSKKSAIPSIRTTDPALNRVLDALKQNVDSITGQARNVEKLELLPETASTADVIAKINAIIDRIQ